MDDLRTEPVTRPGVYNMDEAYYHSDPVPEALGGSLSSSGVKLLLPPSCPAIFDHQRRHGKRPSKAMDLGTVVHGMVLGTGQEVAVLDFENFTTNKAKEAKAKAIADGKVPMLAGKYAEAEAIARAVRDHPTAGALFAEGDAEQSGFWRDPEFGVWRRVRWDWLTPYEEAADLKTCASASPDDVARAMYDYGYYTQNAWYRDGWAELIGNGEQPRDFLNVFVQTEPPYLITIARLKDEHVELGRQRCREALERYRDCTEAGVWPAWSEDIIDISLPYWAERRIESEILREYDY
jgi:hypothetical protein